MNSQTIAIHGKDFFYAAQVGRGLIERAGSLAREVVGRRRAAIIHDRNLPPVLVRRVVASFADFSPVTITVPAGENSKSLRQVEHVCGELSAFDRSTLIVGLGGGVVGDLSGFVAAIFHRGIPHVQIPTTLLAMVDSSIGGKTAVNLPAGKNLVGAIHHPALVVADPDVLETLPKRELRQGYAEIVKHAIIHDAEMFRDLISLSRENADAKAGLPGFAPNDELIARNIRIKATVIADDVRDVSGVRAVLNFGHTVGHAIERASDFQIPHGECVSLGIVAACEISRERAGLPEAQRDEVLALLTQLELPTRLPAGISRDAIMTAVAHDKKFEGGNVRFVVTPQIGEAYLSREVTMGDIQEAVARL